MARFVAAGDISAPLLEQARRHYGRRFSLARFDAQSLPFADRSFDVVILFEALYYLADATRFFQECRRVLRPGGRILLSTANKDLFDFNPSPHSHRYLGVVELTRELAQLGFSATCFGDTPVTSVGVRQRTLRPIKAVAARFGLIPGSMRAKELLKRLVFGRLVPMPAEIDGQTARPVPPTPLDPRHPDRVHKVVFCSAVLSS
jgi:SAM-dependent methyltransferase